MNAGIYGAIFGLIFLLVINCFTTYLLLKARNKFKRTEINNLSDLAYEIYGTQTARTLTDLVIVITQFSFLVAYNIYFGD